MKYNHKWLLAFLPIACLTSCAEDVFEDYSSQVKEPESISQTRYLNEFKPLKEYLNNNSFILSASADVTQYSKKGAVFGLVSSNFKEISSENAYHKDLVANGGTINLASLYDLVNAAKESNQIYGPNLLSFINQNTTYLKSVIADKPDPNAGPIPTQKKWIEIVDNGDCEGSSVASFYWTIDQKGPSQAVITNGAGKAGSRGIVLNATAKVKESWDNQFFIKFTEPIAAGTPFKFSMDIKAKSATGGGISTQEHANPSEYLWWAFAGSPEFTNDWVTYTYEGTINSANTQSMAFNLNDFADANDYYFDNISFKIEKEVQDPFYWDNIITNGDCEGESVASFYWTIDQKGPSQAVITDGAGKNGSRGLVLNATAKVKESWDNQFFIKFTEPIAAGTPFKFSMDIKAKSATGGISTQEHANPSEYLWWAFAGSPEFTSDWVTYTYEGTINSANTQSMAFNLNDFADANTYYFDNLVFEIEKEILSTIPLTQEEKEEALSNSSNKWISSTISSIENANAFNVFSEIFDYTGAIKTNLSGENEFSWSDYFENKDEFFRNIVKESRDAGAKQLFVNESNLESSETKLDNVITWINNLESDNATKIDGISAVIKAIYYEDAEKMASWKTSFETMLNKMVKSNKLVRISDFNVSYDGVDNHSLTIEQQKQLGELYNYVVKTYLNIVPENQRYGISFEIEGLWTDKYSRKPQYEGLVNGLSN